MPLKSKLHPRNLHNSLYNFDELISKVPNLSKFLLKKDDGIITVDFSKPEVVYMLNKALLLHYYDLTYWDIPQNNLIPPIPGRADYIHYLADIIQMENHTNCSVLDIGTGASLIYPIIGTFVYNWKFVATDIDKKSLENATEIIHNNKRLLNTIELRHQENSKNILKGVVVQNDQFDAVMCNPPFFKNAQEANFQTKRKIKGLTKKDTNRVTHNFSGLHNELWCEGGELKFISSLINESLDFKHQIKWFTCLVSNENNLKILVKKLVQLNANHKIIDMAQGNKKSRILVWNYY